MLGGTWSTTEHIDEAAWLAMVSHPFRLQAGGQRIDQQLCYLGTLLQVWDDAADVGIESTRGVIEPGSSRTIPLVIRMECGAVEPGGSRAIEPVVRMGCMRAIESVVRMRMQERGH